MVRICFLCDQRGYPNSNISLHSFPKRPDLREKWLKACGLSSKDDVRGILICCDHFDETDFLRGNPLGRVKLQNNAVPQFNLKNPLVIGESNDEMMHTKMEVLDESPTFLKKNVLDDDQDELENTVTSHEELSCDDNAEDIFVDYEALSADETTTQVLNSEEENTTSNEDNNLKQLKKRRFFEPRYVSELTISDFADPDVAARTIRLIKDNDKSKTKKISFLQRQVRQLQKKINFLEQKVDHLRKHPVVKVDDEFFDITDETSVNGNTV